MQAESRFNSPSATLALKQLLRRTSHILWGALGIALIVHGTLALWQGVQQEVKVVKPLTTQFVKRQPRLTKPLELKKRPRPKRRAMQRKMVSIKAKVGWEEQLSHIQPVELIQGLARPQVDLSRGVSFLSAEMEPQTMAQTIGGTKEAQNTIDMSLEMLDVEALNTGRYDALVIQDPSDKRNVKGFCHLSVLYIPRVHIYPSDSSSDRVFFEWYVVRSVRRLAEAMNRYTLIRTDVLAKVQFGDERLFKTPWIFTLALRRGYELSDMELEILGQYLMAGGFVFADGFPTSRKDTAAGFLSNQKALLGALSTQGIAARYEELPNHHPIYHCYFDFGGPMPSHTCYGNPYHGGKLEGLEVDGRLVAILSSLGYYSPWADWGPDTISSTWYQNADPTRHLQFGVNLIIFALTQEGSITNRVMGSVSY